MNCGYCGAEVTNRRGYCLRCGTKQPESVEQIPEYTDSFHTLAPEPVVFDPMDAARAAEDAPTYTPEFPREDNWEPWPDFDEQDDDLGYCQDVPALILPTRRSLGKMFFLGILTLGIYPQVIWSRMVTELNIVASRRDGKRTMPLFAMMLLCPLTLGIFGFIWMHRFCNRIGAELKRIAPDKSFGARDFWLWNVLGALIVAGPFVFTYRLTKAMNAINQNFNSHG